MNNKIDNIELIRVLVWFNKDNDDYVGEYTLNILDINELKKIFNVTDSDEQMINCYPVFVEQASYLESLLNIEIDLEKYDYFVECYGNK
ncbi:hypothetical protein MiYa_03415 [Microcystis aeruginosa NIES-2519]|jgi:hypothetical protein|uniref:DUF7683 domain-containing protein n=2 Tax=Microcystis aeruginosa TaxID=1126 RepID=A0AAD3B273_MICAE|nr:hypothetical protein [Microcystis aeruginosa]GCA71872.1 hypothetical protein MiYa_03415 [Microcystis aeruginosa NIES-2519]GCA84962.1 hypothetical protein MiHa_02938 [Microcystis aeruginosa NIES-2522]GCL60281.1 hypothetical protein NIES3807_34620 [Microcystis aeruginosa NIES-3807]